MLLRRLINQRGRVVLLATVLLAACAGPATRDAGESRERTGAPPAGDEAGEVVIPPEALTMFEQAAAVMASGDFVDAELRFKEFVLLYPDFPGAHVNLAIIHAGRGDDEAAKAAIDAALAIDPDHPAALNQLGMLLRRNGKFTQAEAAYLKAVTVSPDYALAHYNLGVLYELYLQRLYAALQHFEIYQGLVGRDEQVEKWIADLRRRVTANQRTANIAE